MPTSKELQKERREIRPIYSQKLHTKRFGIFENLLLPRIAKKWGLNPLSKGW